MEKKTDLEQIERASSSEDQVVTLLRQRVIGTCTDRADVGGLNLDEAKVAGKKWLGVKVLPATEPDGGSLLVPYALSLRSKGPDDEDDDLQ